MAVDLHESERLAATEELVTELRLWRLTRSLQRVLVEMGNGRMQASRSKDSWEARNVLDRWLLSFQLDHAGSMDPLLPLLPLRLRLEDSASRKLMDECLEKRFSATMANARRIAEAMIAAVQDFKEIVRRPPDAGEEFVAFEENPATKEGRVVASTFASPCCQRVWFLARRFGLLPTARMLLRYESLGTGSLQWGDPVTVHRALHASAGVRYEGFASPLNSKLLGLPGARFCSLFSDTDANFGSIGSFFDVDFQLHAGGWTVNPPFIEELMNRVADKVLRHLETGAEDAWFFLTFPKWTDCRGWAQLDASPFKKTRVDLSPMEFVVQNSYGEAFSPRNTLSIFAVGRVPSPADEHEFLWRLFASHDLLAVRKEWRLHCDHDS